MRFISQFTRPSSSYILCSQLGAILLSVEARKALIHQLVELWIFENLTSLPCLSTTGFLWYGNWSRECAQHPQRTWMWAFKSLLLAKKERFWPTQQASTQEADNGRTEVRTTPARSECEVQQPDPPRACESPVETSANRSLPPTQRGLK